MQKENNTRREPRPRLSRDVYRTAEQVEEIVRHKEVFPDAAALIHRVMVELANQAGVSFDHPDLIRPFLIACERSGFNTYELFSKLRRASHFAAAPGELARMCEKYDPPAPASLTALASAVDDSDLSAVGILRDDTLTLELIPAGADPREGELIALADRATVSWQGVGRYYGSTGDNPEAFNAKYYPVYWASGGGLAVEKDKYVAFRVVSFTRALQPEPDTEEGVTAREDDTQERLKELRARLERLKERDDITDCSARFSLEKQIFDLEHPLNTDDWSEWEKGGDD